MASRKRGRGPNREQLRPPDGRMRASQIVTTFGPGSLLDLLDDAALVGGLDFWRLGDDTELVREPRLLEAIAPLFREKKWALSRDRPFRKPPVGDERAPTPGKGIQVYEFPRWFVCQNPGCRALMRASALQRVNNEYRHACTGRAKPERCVPVRFMVACRRGHLADVDWPWWCHDKHPCAAPQLRLDEGLTGDFSDIEVRCTTCNRKRRLTEMTVEERQERCSGERPWLGNREVAREPCDEKQRLLIRTASNSYFAQTMSVVTIPEPPSLRRKVREAWEVLKAATPETLPVFRTIEMVQRAVGEASDADVMAAITAEREGRAEATPDIRTAEWLKFLSEPLEAPGEMPLDREDDFWARRVALPPGTPPGLSSVVLARRLRVVQAQVGFTRLEPLTKDLQGRYDLGVQLAPLSLQQDWLPVTEVQGEGFLVTLDEAQLSAWETSAPVQRRTEVLHRAWKDWAAQSRSAQPFPGVRLYLLHALSHLLMTEVSLECGYPASALQERLYCDAHDAAVPMAGILISTGTTGAEGTLGGLVEEGRRLGQHLRRAWARARLCSNDPVCAQHEPGARGERHLEGAACHGCLFAPEVSCERFNQFLDRALVVPTLGHEDVAFFGRAWT